MFRKKMRVLFIKRNNRKDKMAKASVYCRIKVDGIVANDFSTFVQVDQSDWDADKQRVKGKSLRANDDNLKLSQIYSDLTRLFLQFQASNESLSAQHLADLYTGRHMDLSLATQIYIPNAQRDSSQRLKSSLASIRPLVRSTHRPEVRANVR